ncbi:MAG TPA: class I SAM-dependent methyltransferase [Pyrinomonadaceae bacterium]|jgi:SAM-dependent methyltransferase|nr:class I SAM-dependent methyltransferase [Pyrinomonadaceae bacterium]
MSDSVDRFSNRVANYVKYRPDYPREIVAFLAKTCGLTPRWTIADVGCGPGISSKLFLENGNRVYGIEPNDAMREASSDYLRGQGKFTPVNGTSHDTTLPDASVNMVVAAQAFHWFELLPTRREFRRILKPNGRIVLMWNERQLDTTPFLIDYEAYLIKWSTDYSVVRHENIAAEQLGGFFRHQYGSATFANKQIFDFAGLKGRMSSSSYVPSPDSEVYPQMLTELRNLFAKHSVGGKIEILYDTNVYYSLT